jgi:hydroxypyruvate isomerase
VTVLKLAANLSTLFREVPLLERFAAARVAGFHAVELQFPYDVDAADLRDALRANDLRLALINAPAGDLAKGERGLALGDGSRFEDAMQTALDYARATGCRQVHVLIGKAPAPLADKELNRVAHRLRKAADDFGAEGIGLLLEALNRHDQPSYALPTMEAADAVRREVASPHLKLLLDTYHVTREGGDPIAALRKFFPAIGHVQISRAPDRSEPDDAEVDALAGVLGQLGYGGFVGCEYNPRHETLAGLGWAARHGIGIRHAMEPCP